MQVSETQREEPSSARSEVAIVFAEAMKFYCQGQLNRAIELFEEVIAASRNEDTQEDDIACVAAHISLYKIHRALGHEREASEQFTKAVSLGASAQRLKEF
jgi:Tfp pilus assembly protein PilF